MDVVFLVESFGFNFLDGAVGMGLAWSLWTDICLAVGYLLKLAALLFFFSLSCPFLAHLFSTFSLVFLSEDPHDLMKAVAYLSDHFLVFVLPSPLKQQRQQ